MAGGILIFGEAEVEGNIPGGSCRGRQRSQKAKAPRPAAEAESRALRRGESHHVWCSPLIVLTLTGPLGHARLSRLALPGSLLHHSRKLLLAIALVP